MNERKRHRDGLGWGPNGWIKHDLIRQAMGGQVAVLRRRFPGPGLLIDMHAGTGEGIEIANGNLDLFRPNVSDATAALCCRFASEDQFGTKVILCESHPERRERLRKLYGDRAEIISSNRLLLRRDLRGQFAWAMVLNDPNGPSNHAMDVMQYIARSIEHADFIINVNLAALDRLSGVNPDGEDTGPNAKLVQAVRASAAGYAWMSDPEQWRRRLDKRHLAWAHATVNHRAMRGWVILVANYISDGVRDRLFGRS